MRGICRTVDQICRYRYCGPSWFPCDAPAPSLAGCEWWHDVRDCRFAAFALVALVVRGLPAAGTLLRSVQTACDGTGLDAARGLAIGPDGANAYATSYEDDAVLVFGRDAATSAVLFMETHRDRVGGVEGLDGPRGASSARTASTSR